MKLTKKSLIELLQRLESGWTVYKAAKKAGITIGYAYKPDFANWIIILTIISIGVTQNYSN